MKRFDIITETDARVLAHGEPVMLARGGHITPLAQDTLREKRITVVAEGRASAEDASLAPPADIRIVAIASDHTGITLRQALVAFLRGRGLTVNDLGTHTTDAVDYPDVAASVARLVARGEADGGIVIDGAGLGSAIAANKVRGVRAAMCTTPTLARYARQHNGANVLALGATLIDAAEAKEIVDVWLSTPMSEARYVRRLLKVRRLEERF